jgi:hypothetical protein
MRLRVGGFAPKPPARGLVAPGALVSALLCGAAAANGCANVAGITTPDTNPAKQHCVNGIKDQDETDIDCGGKDCLACGSAACKADGECQSAACSAGKCKHPTCSDGVWDGYESSLDCGDPRGVAVGCSPCGLGVNCFNGCNCQSAFCDPDSSTCAESPSGALNCDYCKDGVLDADEGDVDCGGTTPGCPRCAPGKRCAAATDCASVACNAGVCG